MLRKVRDYKRLAATNHLVPKRRNEHRDRGEELKRQGKQCATRRSLEERGRDLVEPSQVLKNFLDRSPLARLLQTEEDTVKHLRVLQRYSEGKTKPIKELKKGKSFTTMLLPQAEVPQLIKMRKVNTFQGVKKLGPQSPPVLPKRPAPPKEPERPSVEPARKATKPPNFKKENYLQNLANSYRKVFSARPNELTPTKTRMKRSRSLEEKRRTPSVDSSTRSKSDYILEALVKEKLIGKDISSKPLPLFTKRNLLKLDKKVEKPAPKEQQQPKKEATPTKNIFRERIKKAIDTDGKSAYQLLSELSKESKDASAIPIVNQKIKDVVMDSNKVHKSEEIRHDSLRTADQPAITSQAPNPTGSDVGTGDSVLTTYKEKAKSADASIKTCNDYLSCKTAESESEPKKHQEREKFDLEAAILEAKKALEKENYSNQNGVGGNLKINTPPWKEYKCSDLITPMGSNSSLSSSSDSTDLLRTTPSDLQRKPVGNKKDKTFRVWQPPKEIEDPDMAIGGRKFKGNVEKYFHHKNGGAIKLQEALKKSRITTEPTKVEKEALQPQIYPKTSLIQKATSLPLQLCHKMMQKEATPQSAAGTQDKKNDEEVLPGLVFTVEDKTVKDGDSGFFERLTKWFSK